MAKLRGARELRARLRALGPVFKPMGRKWADETARLMKPMVPVKTGKSRASIRRRNATQKRATVVGTWTLYPLSKGSKAHTITSKRARRLVFIGRTGRPVFARKVRHPGHRGLGFRGRAAHEALRRYPLSQTLIDEWNKAG